jgi:hypothetical protein
MECVAACGTRHEFLDCGFEVLGFLMRAPSIFVQVKLEKKKQLWIGRRAIRDEKLDPRLCQRRRDKSAENGPDGVGLTFLGFDRDRYDKPVVRLRRAIAALFHRRASRRIAVCRDQS